MPRYFFHLINDINATDEEGQELSGPEAARAQARGYALAMAAQSVIEYSRVDLSHRIDVADQSGEILFSTKFGDVLEIVT